MFVIRVALRSFLMGLAVGVLFAPRTGAETRKMLSDRISAGLDQLLELAKLPPVEPERLRTNGHAERPARRRTPQASTDRDARASS